MNRSLHLLVVDDCSDDVTLLQHTLRRGGYEVICQVVDTPAAMRALLETQQWDIIISDHAMPHFSAPEALALARELCPVVPFIIVSGEIDLNLAVSLMKGGAKDYIQKRELARLVPAVERELGEVVSRRERQCMAAALQVSETRYRRLFETAQDGILILDADTGKIIDVNPFMIAMLGYSKEAFLGKKLWEIGAFKDIAASKLAALELKDTGYVRYENLPLQTVDGAQVAVEFVSNEYMVDNKKIAQCNIRNISERKLTEDAQRKEEILLNQVARFTEELLKTGAEQVSYQKILENLLVISNAKYGVLTLINENTGKFTTIAVAGLNDQVKQVTQILGFGPIGKEWKDYSIENEHLKGKTIVRFSSLSELAKKTIPGIITRTLEKLLDIGETTVTKIFANHQVVGDFTLMMQAGKQFENDTLVEIYSRQIDAFITRINAETEIIKVKEHFEAVFNTSPDGNLITRLSDGQIINANEGFLAMTGFTRDEVVGKSTLELNLYDNLADRQRIVNELGEKGFYKNEEVVFRRKDGSVFTSYMATKVTILHGVEYISSSVHDITGRKQAELALRESEERALHARTRLEKAQSVAHVGDWTWNIKESLVEWSDEMYRIFGMDKNAYTGRLGDAITRVIHPDDLHIVLPSNAPAFVEQKPLEYRVIHPDGSIHHIRAATGDAILDRDGTPLYLTGTCQDITEHRLDIYAIEESAEKYRLLVTQMYQGLAVHEIILDETGKAVDYRFLDVNPSFERLTGLKRAAVIGKTVLEVLPETEVYWIEKYGHVAMTGESLQYENYSKELGKYFEVTAYSPRPGEFAVIISDITDRRLAFNEIQKLNSELEQRVRERTLQLEMVNKELETFNYSVSHDLRAPLRRVMGFTEALQEAESTQNSAESLQLILSIRVSVERMNVLIDALLKLAKFTHAEMNRHSINLSDLVQQIAAELKQSDPARQVEFIIPQDVMANGDNPLLHVVLQNLLSNAWKFTARRQAACIEFGTTPLADGSAAYFVRDNGAGFNMDYTNKLFSTFQRLHSERDFPGIGIGLATVQRIVNRHGGRVWANGTVDKGASFYFTLDNTSLQKHS